MQDLQCRVIGAGSWGTALAKNLADQGYPTMLWSRREDQVQAINANRRNPRYLKDITLPLNLRATASLEEAIEGAELLLIVVPTHGLRDLLPRVAPLIPKNIPVISATKGVEVGSLKLVSEIFEELIPSQAGSFVFLGGPSFAKEVAQGVPTAISIAGNDAAILARAQEALASPRLRVYTTDDVVGVELGGALKNVIAIAAGISDGLGFGHNTRAGLITRGLAEITRLAVKRGANPLTMAGLSGMGDLVLTCTGDLSRNRRVGLALGKGKTLEQILEELGEVAEGVRTTKSAYMLAQREGVEMPITEQIYSVLYEGKSAMEGVGALMTRPPRAERE